MNLSVGLLLIRALMFALCWNLALYIRQAYLSGYLSGPSRFGGYFASFWIALLVFLVASYLTGALAKKSFMAASLGKKLYCELKANVYSAVFFSVLAFFLQYHLLSRTFVLLIFFTNFVIWLFCWILFPMRSKKKKRALWLGEKGFYEKLKQWIYSNQLPIVFLELKSKEHLDEDLKTCLEKWEPDEVFCSNLDIELKEQLYEQISAKRLKCKIRDVTALSVILGEHVNFSRYEPYLKQYFCEPSGGSGVKVKRLTDLIITLGLTPLWVPVYLSLCCFLFLTQKEVFFSQLRVGQFGELFKIYKFCTMNPTEDSEKPHTDSDERLTTVGRLLRRTSLDEIPQFFNVLKGEMSLVGPRPELVAIVNRCYSPYHWKRNLIKPGLTGLWQIYGRKQPIHEHLKYDFYYLKHHNFWLDLWILLKTIPAVFFKRGAY
jgi:lipopolysaccharide/colanic/teichoic acid biosynthesis glycosyltransferase